MRLFALTALLVLTGLAGCLNDDPGEAPVLIVEEAIPGLAASAMEPILLNESIVDAVVTPFDAYEPTMDVCDDGSIYITGHTFLVDTTGAPVFGSYDDGGSWEQLPWFQTLDMPLGLAGSTPPPSDEIFLSCGEDGWLYGGDITLATFPVNGWSNSGQSHSYHNPNAYDEYQAVAQIDECVAAPIKDRPWVAYGNGQLLLVNNDGAGPAQIGVIDVPPLVPVNVGATTGLGRWNMCAGPNYAPAQNSIEGIPDMHSNGFFAVPQLANDQLMLTMGNAANVFNLDTKAIFPFSSGGEITSVYGQAVFDSHGNLFAGVSTNSAPDDDGNRTGAMTIALSTDAGETFESIRFEGDNGYPLRHFYLDGHKNGTGALAVWAIDAIENDTVVGYDWYMGHLMPGADGPVLKHVTLVIDDGLQPSAHVTGAAVGPDGRAYTAMYDASREAPLSVFIQRDGPTLPNW